MAEKLDGVAAVWGMKFGPGTPRVGFEFFRCQCGSPYKDVGSYCPRCGEHRSDIEVSQETIFEATDEYPAAPLPVVRGLQTVAISRPGPRGVSLWIGVPVESSDASAVEAMDADKALFDGLAALIKSHTGIEWMPGTMGLEKIDSDA